MSVDPLGACELALGQLELVAQAARLVAGDDAGELRIEAEPPLDPAEEGERHADRLAVGQEGPEDQAAVQVGADHRGDGIT